ncbi:conserved protein with FAD/NAD(P)-binding domain [Escherichia coli]|uniref:Conserved protein with FAD/NAD(P)-binding domain n=1 Tax=Escherichia coli TaxID=562 RepID=A0A376LNB3_ECOLX|nr:conserved protein with FAD/NAD(P)-binding domain [Escherichia coli]
MEINESRTVLKTEDNSYSFDVFIDARGQRPLKVKDIPFPGLREQLQKTGDEIPDVGEDYTLQQPEEIRGPLAFGAFALVDARPAIRTGTYGMCRNW